MEHIKLEILMPFLNRGNWEHQGMCLNRQIIATENRDRGLPLIGYGEDSPKTVSYVVTQTLKVAEITQESLEETAIRNLKARPNRPGWQVSLIDWEDAQRPVLSRSGDELTASDLLDPEFLKSGHDELGSSEILVAVPTRSLMFACLPDMAAAIGMVAKNQYQIAFDAESDAVSEYLFTIVDGQMTGYTKP